MSKTRVESLLFLTVLASAARAASAEEMAPPAAPAARYSLPWQLRPLVSANVVRADSTIALYDRMGRSGTTVATVLALGYKLTPEISPLLRLAFVADAPPGSPEGAGSTGTALVNPVLGAMFATKISSDFRLSAFAGVAIPIGQGGGDEPDPKAVAAATGGIAARSAMDNAMFAVNYLTAIGGADLGWVADDLTVQVELTVFQLFRARGPSEMTDSARTNLTSGLHVGYFVIPELSLGGELRYQRWLSDAAPVRANPEARETITAAIGPRLHLQLGDTWIRPGIAYARGIDQPLTRGNYHMVQVDLPVIF